MAAENSTRQFPELSNEEISRYSRHIIIPEIGMSGQMKLKQSRVLLVGTGGLGSPAATYLAAAGVGTIGLVEFDHVESSNLQRQTLYTENDVGQLKVSAAAKRLRSMNKHIEIIEHNIKLDASNALEIISHYDLVLDGTDNFPTRYLVNDACVLLNKPNVYASVFRFEGQLSVFNYLNGPCYRCIFPTPPPPELAPSCSEGGVFGVLPGIMGTMQAAEAIKILTNTGEKMHGRLLRFDALTMEFAEFVIKKNTCCEICGDSANRKALIGYADSCRVESQPTVTLEVDEINPVELQRLIESNEPMQLIDVRTINEYQIVNINGSILMPLDELDETYQQLQREVNTVIYCKSGVRSKKAAMFLKQQGFKRISSLQGGVIAWSKLFNKELVVY